jgi:hypothetical protein
MAKRMIIRGGLLVLVLGLVYGGLDLAGAAPNVIGPPTQTVTVANTAADPVPVQQQGTATVNVTNTTAVPVSGTVTVGGMPNVTLDSSGNTVKLDPAADNVQVANSFTSPVNVANVNDGQNPYGAFEAGSAPKNSGGGCVTFPPVPSGLRLVAEYVSAKGFTGSGDLVAWASLRGDATESNPELLAPTNITGPNGSAFVVSQQVRDYIGAGIPPEVCVFFLGGPAQDESFLATVDGYYVKAG